MAILSIQSQVAAGHVGNSAAAFALQRLGQEVWAVPSVLLSHHPGHGGATGGNLPPAQLAEILQGLRHRGCFARCQAVLSGYLGHPDHAPAVLRAVQWAKAATADAVYLCDPVLGDEGRFYVGEGILTAMRELAAKADIVTPNAFELAQLSGTNFTNRAEALQAMRVLQHKGPRIVILTSFTGSDSPAGTLETLALDGEAGWALKIPDLGRKFNGAGDLLAALFLDRWLHGRQTGGALAAACGGVQAVLSHTAAQGADELLLIETQHALAPPTCILPERIF